MSSPYGFCAWSWEKCVVWLDPMCFYQVSWEEHASGWETLKLTEPNLQPEIKWSQLIHRQKIIVDVNHWVVEFCNIIIAKIWLIKFPVLEKRSLLSYKMSYNYTKKSFEYFCHTIYAIFCVSYYMYTCIIYTSEWFFFRYQNQFDSPWRTTAHVDCISYWLCYIRWCKTD